MNKEYCVKKKNSIESSFLQLHHHMIVVYTNLQKDILIFLIFNRNIKDDQYHLLLSQLLDKTVTFFYLIFFQFKVYIVNYLPLQAF